MKADALIPIVVGITGHRVLRAQDVPALRAAVREELMRLQADHPHSPIVLLNSLAEGGDQLCAEVAQSLGIPWIAVLPMEREAYREDFSGAARTRFDALCEASQAIFTAPLAEPVPETPDRSFYYRQAGVYVSAHAHVLLALWDGAPPQPGGCGTAEAVDFMLRGAPRTRDAMLRPDGDGAVIHILTPRGEDGEAGAVRFLGEAGVLRETLSQTDAFNERAMDFPPTAAPLAGPDAVPDPLCTRLAALYRAADGLSGVYARTYRRILAALALMGTMVILVFLLYDELNLPWLLLVCGAVFCCALISLRHAKKTACHSLYLEYRALAETLRVQFFLRLSGTALEVTDLLSWTQRLETLWIKEALSALCAAPPPRLKQDIRDRWLADQRDYHRQAGQHTEKQLRSSKRNMRFAFSLAIAAFFAALVFSILERSMGGLALFQTALNVLLGVSSALSVFGASYYDKLSLSRKAADHKKMELFYQKALARLDASGQTDALLKEIAREELIENANWCSYQRDNEPDIQL